MVSRKHGKVLFIGKRYWLKDLGSINGTFINTVRPRTISCLLCLAGETARVVEMASG
jgi:hypothetical protein